MTTYRFMSRSRFDCDLVETESDKEALLRAPIYASVSRLLGKDPYNNLGGNWMPVGFGKRLKYTSENLKTEI
jgi:hypothetical protein